MQIDGIQRVITMYINSPNPLHVLFFSFEKKYAIINLVDRMRKFSFDAKDG